MELLELGEKIEQEARFYRDLRALQHAADDTADFLATLKIARGDVWKFGTEASDTLSKYRHVTIQELVSYDENRNFGAHQKYIGDMIDVYLKIKEIIDNRISEIRKQCSHIVGFLSPSPRIERRGMRFNIFLKESGGYEVDRGYDKRTDKVVISQSEFIYLNELLKQRDVDGLIKFCRCAIASADFMELAEMEIDISRKRDDWIREHPLLLLDCRDEVFFDRPDIFVKIQQEDCFIS